MRNFSRRELLLIAFFMGLAAGIIQVLLIREILTLCRGNELIIGIVYASWFLGIYAGARLKPAEAVGMPARRLYLSIFMLPVVAAVSIYSMYLVQIVFPRAPGSFYSFAAEILFALLFTMPAGFFVGLFFPSLVSLFSSDAGERSGGMVYCIDSLGFFAGGIVFSFLLVDHANPLGIISLLLFAAILMVFRRRERRFIALAVIPLLLLFFSGRIEKQIIAGTWNRTHTGSFIQHSRTKFGSVALESSGEGVSVYGDGIIMYSLPDRYESRGIFHLVESLREDRRRILLFGSGPGSLMHNLLRSDIDVLYYLEPDADLWRILLPYIKTFYPGQDTSKLVVPVEELKHFLKNSTGKFDMIISIPPEPESIMLNRFYTREFFSLCREHLSEQGILVTSLHGFSDYMSKERRNYIASIYSAFVKEFPAHIKTSGEIVYLAGAKWEGILPAGIDQLVSDYYKTSIAGKHRFENEITANFSPDELRMSFEKTQLEYFDSVIIPASQKTQPNSDLKPAAYWRNMVLSAFKEKSAIYYILDICVIIPAIILLISVLALYDIRRRYGLPHMINGLFIYMTGFISMSTMLVMVLIYQNMSGIVYHHIALINSLYMLGLGTGSYYFTRRRALKLHQLFACIAAALIPVYVLTVHDSMLLFWLVIPVFSFLCGAVFPVLFINRTGDYYASASVLDSMDHFGAIAGSILTVLFLVPMAGIELAIVLNMVLVIPACVTGYVMYRAE